MLIALNISAEFTGFFIAAILRYSGVNWHYALVLTQRTRQPLSFSSPKL
jgi:hypothetical protein